MADSARMAREMWTLFEPVHAVTYFAPEARSTGMAYPSPIGVPAPGTVS